MSVLPMFLPVPILQLGMVRHTWSSHLAQGCYTVIQLAALRFEPMTCIFRVPHAIHLATMSQTSDHHHCNWHAPKPTDKDFQVIWSSSSWLKKTLNF